MANHFRHLPDDTLKPGFVKFIEGFLGDSECVADHIDLAIKGISTTLTWHTKEVIHTIGLLSALLAEKEMGPLPIKDLEQFSDRIPKDFILRQISTNGIAWLVNAMPTIDERKSSHLANTAYKHIVERHEVHEKHSHYSGNLLGDIIRKIANGVSIDSDGDVYNSSLFKYCSIEFLTKRNLYSTVKDEVLPLFDSCPGMGEFEVGNVDCFEHGHLWANELARVAFSKGYPVKPVINGLTQILQAIAEYCNIPEAEIAKYKRAMIIIACAPFPAARAAIPFDLNEDDFYPTATTRTGDYYSKIWHLRGPFSQLEMGGSEGIQKLRSWMGEYGYSLSVTRALDGISLDSSLAHAWLKENHGVLTESAEKWFVKNVTELGMIDGINLIKQLDKKGQSEDVCKAAYRFAVLHAEKLASRPSNIKEALPEHPEWKSYLISHLLEEKLVSPSTLKLFNLKGADFKPHMKDLAPKLKKGLLSSDLGI